jgi:hypothetical protein
MKFLLVLVTDPSEANNLLEFGVLSSEATPTDNDSSSSVCSGRCSKVRDDQAADASNLPRPYGTFHER